MAVGLAPLATLHPVAGFDLGIASAGIKKVGRKDLVVMRCAEGSSVAGVYTQNAFCAAPVQLCKARKNNDIAYLVVNTGNANAATGELGLRAAQQVCADLAQRVGTQEEQILPFSTGVIGEPLPVDKIISALGHALADLKPDNWAQAAEGIMTTDTLPKAVSRQFSVAGTRFTITGMSKGAGMIRPNMATMLGFIATDFAIEQELLQTLVKEVANKSFNRISIDGDTSTNDSFVVIATGKAANSQVTDCHSELYQVFREQLMAVATELAQAIVRDGEGATKFVTVQVNGGANQQECLDVAYAIAHSPLIKTAIFASDPNWGRIACAVGYAGVSHLDISKVDIYLGDVQIVQAGGRAPDYTEEQGAAVMQQAEITIRIELGRGNCSEVLWTTDLSYEYVRINADYRS